jgi:hypothetical protein
MTVVNTNVNMKLQGRYIPISLQPEISVPQYTPPPYVLQRILIFYSPEEDQKEDSNKMII